MGRTALIPPSMRLLPFRGSDARRDGTITSARLRGSAWVRLLPDVYVRAEVEMDHRLWAYAACLYAGPGAAVSGVSAALAWGVDVSATGLPPDADAVAPVEVTVPAGRRVRPWPPRLSVVRSALPATDLTTFGLLTLTTPERTAVDCVRRLSRPDGIATLDALLHRRVVSMEALVARASASAGRYAGAAFLDAVRLAEPGAESPMESRLRVVLVDGGLSRPVAQFEVFDRYGRLVGRVDLAYPTYRVGLEYEGDHHRDRATFRRDIARVNALQDEGWMIVRVTADDIFLNPAQLVQRIARLLAIRRPLSS